MTTTELNVFEGRWGNKTYVFALSEAIAREKVMTHFAFGDPDEDDYAIGNVWAKSNDNDGWRITERLVVAGKVDGRKRGGKTKNETSHINWECPVCNQQFSEDRRENEESPLLVKCGCKNEEKYFLIGF